MAQPITWQNVMGPSLADASRPLDAAQRTFSNLFDGLGNVLRDAEMRQEVGRNLTKDRNRDTILDLYANAKTPEQVAAAQAQEAVLRQQFGDMLRAGDVRGAGDQRLNAVRAQMQQGWTFDNAQRDQNEAPLVDEIKAQLASNDPAVRAIGLQRAQEAQVRQRAALVAAGTEAERTGLRWDEEKKGFVRADEKHKDDLFNSKFNRGIASRQVAVSEGQLGVARTNAATGQFNAQTSRKQFELGVEREVRDVQRENAEFQAKMTANIGKVASYSSASKEGASEINDAIAKIKDPDMQRMAINVANRLKKEGANVGTVLSGIGSIRPESSWNPFDFESGIENAAYKAAMANAPAAEEQVKSANYQRGRYVEQGDQAGQEAVQQVAQLRALAGGRPVVPVAAEPAPVNVSAGTNPFGMAAPPATIAGAVNGAEAPPPPETPATRLASAEARLKAAATAGKGKGYYSPEALEWRRAEAAVEDARGEVQDLNDEAAEKRNDQLKRIRFLENRLKVQTAEAAKFTSKERAVPKNVARLLEQDAEDLKILKERLGVK